MPRFTLHTLFWKYAAYFSGLVSALLILSGGLAGYFAYRQSVSALEELQREKARYVAYEIATFISGVEDTLQSTASKFSANDGVDVGVLSVELTALLRYQPSITEVYWVAANGRERLKLSQIGRDEVESSRSWSDDLRFQALRTRFNYVAPVHFRDETEPYVSIAVSRNPGGQVLVADVNLKFVSDLISKIHVAPTEVTYVVDKEGRLISHADMGLVLRKTNLSELPQVRAALERNDAEGLLAAEPHNLDGLAVIVAAVPIEHLGWTVFAEQLRAEAFRPVYSTIARSSGLVLFGVIAAIFTSLAFARRMVRPIRQIEASAREIGEGRLDQRIEVKTGDELEALGAQFNRMAERLRTIYTTQETRIAERTHDLALANEAKSRFLASASHDLRQPMHALALFVGQLRISSGSPDATALLEKVQQSVDALEQLLDALLDLSKLDMGAITAQAKAFSLQDLLSRLARHLAPVAEAKGLALTLVPTSLWVCSDPVLLERILINVITNAIRYTYEGRVLIGCRRRGDRVHLVIADTGVGIAPAHLPNIFQEFYRVASSDRETKGLGLGLAIVKRLASLLNHEVTVESVPGKGTTVRVSIPRAIPQADVPALPGEPTPELHGTRILVVDDEAAVREAIDGLLRQWGCDVVVAGGGDESLERTQHWRPDVVLCDLTLAGGESGLDVVDRLRRNHGTALPCAFITGESASEVIDTVRGRGYPIAFKPTKPAKLRALLEHLLRYAQP